MNVLDAEVIDNACATAYRHYIDQREAHYRRYFRDRPTLASSHPLLARDLDAALPAGWAHLGELLQPEDRHRWHLSAKSSQTLVLGVVGAGTELDPTLRWLSEGLKTDLGRISDVRFELTVQPDLLGERPRQTSLDLLVDAEHALVVLEAKWTEMGLGRCSCGNTRRAGARCSARVRERRAYWSAAQGIGLDATARPCQLGNAYQAVRNVAASHALASGRRAIAVLLYDHTNPYFGGVPGQWEGWAEWWVEHQSKDVTLRSLSWQNLVAELPRDRSLHAWMRDKHRLVGREPA